MSLSSSKQIEGEGASDNMGRPLRLVTWDSSLLQTVYVRLLQCDIALRLKDTDHIAGGVYVLWLVFSNYCVFAADGK